MWAQSRRPWVWVLVLVLGWGASWSQAQERLRVGFLPLLPSAHEFIAAEKNWYRELGTGVEELRFNSGLPIVKALGAGQMDIGYIDIGTALAAVTRGIKAKIIAAATINNVAVVACDPFAESFERWPNRNAIREFHKGNGRLLRIGTFASGATPHLIALHWLSQLQVDAFRDVEIVTMGPDQLRFAIQAQQVDVAVTVEPIITLSRKAKMPYRVIAWSKDIAPAHPGSVLFARQALLDEKPEIAEKLLLLQLRATALLSEEKDEAARLIAKKIGADILPVALARETLDSLAVRWVANPRNLVDSATTYNRFQVTMGLSRTRIATHDLFDFRFYDGVIAKQPQYRRY